MHNISLLYLDIYKIYSPVEKITHSDAHYKWRDILAFAAGFLKCVWPFWDIVH